MQGEPGVYELRRGREVLCWGTVPWLGYQREALKRMHRDGYCLFFNGKKVRLWDIEG